MEIYVKMISMSVPPTHVKTVVIAITLLVDSNVIAKKVGKEEHAKMT